MEGDDGLWRMVGVGNHVFDSSYPIVLCVDHHKEKNGGAERGFSSSSCGVPGTVSVDMAGQDTRFIGEGGLADYSREKARVWIQKAAEGGDESAIAHLKKLNDEDEAEVVRKAAEEEAKAEAVRKEAEDELKNPACEYCQKHGPCCSTPTCKNYCKDECYYCWADKIVAAR